MSPTDGYIHQLFIINCLDILNITTATVCSSDKSQTALYLRFFLVWPQNRKWFIAVTLLKFRPTDHSSIGQSVILHLQRSTKPQENIKISFTVLTDSWVTLPSEVLFIFCGAHKEFTKLVVKYLDVDVTFSEEDRTNGLYPPKVISQVCLEEEK